MKFAILSDIHGNIQALEACLKALENIPFDIMIWCGDYVTDMPNGHEVIELIRKYEKEYKTYAIKGNRDMYILEYEDGKHPEWSEYNRYSNVVRTYQSLTKEDLDWLKNLPEFIELECNNQIIYIAHRPNKNIKSKYQIYGDFHRQYYYVKDNVTHINPGAVGITLDGPDVGAQFIILEITEEFQKIECYNIKYNIEDTIKALSEVNNVDKNLSWERMCIEILKTGRDYTKECIDEYNRLRNEKNIKEESLELWKSALAFIFDEERMFK